MIDTTGIPEPDEISEMRVKVMRQKVLDALINSFPGNEMTFTSVQGTEEEVQRILAPFSVKGWKVKYEPSHQGITVIWTVGVARKGKKSEGWK